MDSIIELLTSWGYWGMLASAFLAGSVLPFSSEIVMASLQAAGLDVWQLVAYGTIGNVLGGALNYGVGRLGNLYWIEHYLHVSREKLEKTAWRILSICPGISTEGVPPPKKTVPGLLISAAAHAPCSRISLIRARTYLSLVSSSCGPDRKSQYLHFLMQKGIWM